MAEKKPLGVGMIGAGFLARTRSRCYGKVPGQLGRIVAVTSARAESSRAFAEEAGVPQVASDVEALLALPDVDVVDLCVPNHLHRPLTEAAAAAKKHVICTKPLTAYVGQDLPDDASDEEVATRDRSVMLATAIRDADAMVDATRKNGVRLFYGENWIFSPSLMRARGLLEKSAGSVLEMRGWESHKGSHSPYAWRFRNTGGGALLRLGSHPIGAMLHLKREEGLWRSGKPISPIAVTADIANLAQVTSLDPAKTRVATGFEDVENWGCAVIEFDDGSRSVAYGSDNQLGGMESRLEIFASNCHLKCNLSPHNLLQAYAPDGEVFGDAYIMEKVDGGGGWSTPLPDEDWSSGQLGMCEAFLRDLQDDRDTLSDGLLGRDVVRVIYSAYLAAAEGRKVQIGA